MKNHLILYLLIMINACQNIAQKTQVDLIVRNGTIYTVNNDFKLVEAFAVQAGKIIASGSSEEISIKYTSKDIIDLKGKFVYPGLIDAHCHFYGYARTLQWINLKETKSFDEIVELLEAYHKLNPDSWILGRGWDQNDWEITEFPTNNKLNELFPKTSVILIRVDGHAVLANSVALNIVDITPETKIDGGEILLKNGIPTGVLIDNAADELKLRIPNPSDNEMKDLLQQAQENCFRVGLTSVSDAGLKNNEIKIIKKMQNEETLKMRIYAMLSPTQDNFNEFVKKGIHKDDYLNIRSIKLYADGALGSRGAYLLEPYTDDPDNRGLFVSSEEIIDSICEFAKQNNYQVNTHAIGDDAVRKILDIYSKHLNGINDLRWRIEHSQVVHPDDIDKYGNFNIIPSIQTTHATSDMYWADERLGQERVKTAYAYKDLLNQNGWIPNGSDFPVEDINPLFGFYAAVARKDHKGYPEEGFQMENVLTRKEALKAMTIWAAKSSFEENEKGSIEVGKFADFVILNKDIMSIDLSEIPNLKIQATYINGEKVFRINEE